MKINLSNISVMKHSLSSTPINSRLTTVDWLNLKQTGFPPVRLIGWAHNSTFPIRSPLLPQKHSRVSTRECHSLITIQLPKQPSSSSVLYCYNHMYRTLAYPKMLRSLSDCCIIFNNICCNLDCSFFNITFQKNSPAILIFTLYAGDSCPMFIYVPKFQGFSDHRITTLLKSPSRPLPLLHIVLP